LKVCPVVLLSGFVHWFVQRAGVVWWLLLADLGQKDKSFFFTALKSKREKIKKNKPGPAERTNAAVLSKKRRGGGARKGANKRNCHKTGPVLAGAYKKRSAGACFMASLLRGAIRGAGGAV